jgi:hypothetical protein
MHSGHNFDFIDYIGMYKDYAVVKKFTLVSAKMYKQGQLANSDIAVAIPVTKERYI